MGILFFFLTISTMLFQINTKTIDDSPSTLSFIKIPLKNNAEIAKKRALFAKNIARAPLSILCTAAPVFIFAHYTPHLVAQMNLGTLGVIAFVGLGAFYAGTVGANIGSIFNKKKIT